MKKIFFIGFNKTGTTTVYNIFSKHMRSIHNTEWAKFSHSLSDKEFKKYFDLYDCYSDGELSNFIRLDQTYKESIFILNTRSLYDWIYSRIKHIYRFYPNKASGNMANEWNNHLDKTEIIIKWINKRNLFYKECLDYFKNKNNFYILDIDDPDFFLKIEKISNLKINNLKSNVRNEIKFKNKDYWNNIILNSFNKINLEEDKYKSIL